MSSKLLSCNLVCQTFVFLNFFWSCCPQVCCAVTKRRDGQCAVIVTNQLSSATCRRTQWHCQKISGRVRTLESKAQMAEAVILLLSRSQSTEAWWASSMGSVVAHPHFSFLPGSYSGIDLDIITLGSRKDKCCIF